jgi:hypothetical protein
MAFSDQISLMLFAPMGRNATGVLAPIIRAMGHILYCAGAQAESGYNLTDEEVRDELQSAAAHLTLTTTNIAAAPVSQRAKDYILAWVQAIYDAETEYAGWDHDTRVANFKDLANRAAGLAAFLDGECMGLRGSDPGSSL